MNREQKAQKVADLHERLGRASLAVLTDFTGLDVAEMTELRSKLKEAEAEYVVFKNTLLRLAAKETDFEQLEEYFVGPNGIALAEGDVVPAAKAIHEFIKDKQKLEIKVGVLDGNVIQAADIKALAALPGRDALLAKLLGTLNAVPGGLVQVLAAVPRSLLNVLKAIEDQKAAA